MSNAYKCDQCGEFHEGEPVAQLSVKLTVEDLGILGSLFGDSSNPSQSADLCSINCIDQYSVEEQKEGLLADVEDKQEMLEREAKVESREPEPPQYRGVEGVPGMEESEDVE